MGLMPPQRIEGNHPSAGLFLQQHRFPAAPGDDAGQPASITAKGRILAIALCESGWRGGSAADAQGAAG